MSMSQIVALIAHLMENEHSRVEVKELAKNIADENHIDSDRILEMADIWHGRNFADSL